MKRLRWLLASLGLAAIIAVPQLASADVNDFAITSFTSDQTLTNKDPQGQLRIVERISVDFHYFNHGILRAIPKSYKNHSLQLHVNKISSETGAAAEYTTYSSNGNTVLKIGDPDRTVTGPQEYTIDYTVSNVLGFYDDHTELYWDVNGDQWQQQFARVEATLHLPDDLEQSHVPLCYTGSYGSSAQNCQISTTGNTVHAKTTQPLTANQGLTYVVSLKSGYFHPSKWYETLAEYSGPIIGISLPILVLGGAGLAYWWRRGRDAKGTGVIVPQYDAPDNLKALQVDGLMDFRASNAGITATIIDLAVRGYIQIIETKKDKKLRKDSLSYSLKLLNNDFTGLDENEKSLINALFGSATVGNEVDVSKQKNKLYTTANKLRGDVKQQLTSEGYFRAKTPGASKKRRIGLWILGGLILLVVAVVYGGVLSIIGFVIGGLIAAVCLVSIDARTAKGVAAKEHVEGLKLYLNVAEKQRIKKLQSPDAAYADHAKEPKKTVELFEKLLPFAMVLGVEKQWSKQFESLYTTPPDWYNGNWNTFNAVYLTSHLNDGIGSAVNTAFSSPASSGSSGGGGGFSGGGGGGGGGGGW
jgi:uncharacterized membrane protein